MPAMMGGRFGIEADNPNRGEILRLKEQLQVAVCEHVRRDGAVALVDFPMYANVGDSAIWLGQERILAESGISVAYRSPLPCLVERPGHVRQVLYSGGGNLGDVWPEVDERRRRQLMLWREIPSLMFPQSIYFKDRGAWRRAREEYRAAGELTVFVRDDDSLERGAELFGSVPRLVPDAAFGLGPLSRTTRPRTDILVLARRDREQKENVRRELRALGLRATDWVTERAATGLRALQWSERLLARYPAKLRVLARGRGLLMRRAAAERLVRGLDMLSQGAVVVTDRLHGHVLCALAGIPHVIVDNDNGKVGAFWRRWTRGFEGSRLAGSLQEALDVARQMAGTRAITAVG